MSSSMAEGGHDATLDFKNGPQSLPTDGPENKHPFDMGGADTSWPDGNDMTADDERPTPPNPDAKIGTDVDFSSVAPYKYAEFPKDPPLATGLSGKNVAIIGG